MLWADGLRSVRCHLHVHCPSVVIIYLGLPYGNGSELIEVIHAVSPWVEAVLAASGDIFGEAVALPAGLDGFLPSCFSLLKTFQQLL